MLVALHLHLPSMMPEKYTSMRAIALPGCVGRACGDSHPIRSEQMGHGLSRTSQQTNLETKLPGEPPTTCHLACRSQAAGSPTQRIHSYTTLVACVPRLDRHLHGSCQPITPMR